MYKVPYIFSKSLQNYQPVVLWSCQKHNEDCKTSQLTKFPGYHRDKADWKLFLESHEEQNLSNKTAE